MKNIKLTKNEIIALAMSSYAFMNNFLFKKEYQNKALVTAFKKLKKEIK